MQTFTHTSLEQEGPNIFSLDFVFPVGLGTRSSSSSSYFSNEQKPSFVLKVGKPLPWKCKWIAPDPTVFNGGESVGTHEDGGGCGGGDSWVWNDISMKYLKVRMHWCNRLGSLETNKQTSNHPLSSTWIIWIPRPGAIDLPPMFSLASASMVFTSQEEITRQWEEWRKHLPSCTAVCTSKEPGGAGFLLRAS